MPALRGPACYEQTLARRLSSGLRFRQAHKVRNQPVRPRHSLGQLPEPRVGRVDIKPFAILGDHFPSLKIRFARIVTGHQWFEVRIPIAQKVSPSLLHPAFEVTLGDLVWKVEPR